MPYNTRNWEGVSLGGVSPTPNPLPMLPGESVDQYTVRYMAYTKRKNQAKAKELGNAIGVTMDKSEVSGYVRPTLCDFAEIRKDSNAGVWFIREHDPRSSSADTGSDMWIRTGLQRAIGETSECFEKRVRDDYAESLRRHFADETNPAEPTQAERRREIDALLREDAKRTPAFATARKSAVLAAAEMFPEIVPEDASSLLNIVEHYEEIRGAMVKPSDASTKWRERMRTSGHSCAAHAEACDAGIAAYERARGTRMP